MFPNQAQSQPARPRVLSTVPIRATDFTMQSRCPADGRGVLKCSVPALGILNQVSSCTSDDSCMRQAVSLRDAEGFLSFLHSPSPGAFLLIPENNLELHRVLGGLRCTTMASNERYLMECRPCSLR